MESTTEAEMTICLVFSKELSVLCLATLSLLVLTWITPDECCRADLAHTAGKKQRFLVEIVPMQKILLTEYQLELLLEVHKQDVVIRSLYQLL